MNVFSYSSKEYNRIFLMKKNFVLHSELWICIWMGACYEYNIYLFWTWIVFRNLTYRTFCFFVCLFFTYYLWNLSFVTLSYVFLVLSPFSSFLCVCCELMFTSTIFFCFGFPNDSLFQIMFGIQGIFSSVTKIFYAAENSSS